MNQNTVSTSLVEQSRSPPITLTILNAVCRPIPSNIINDKDGVRDKCEDRKKDKQGELPTEKYIGQNKRNRDRGKKEAKEGRQEGRQEAKEGRKEGSQGGKVGRKEAKEGRKEAKEGRKEGRKVGRQEGR